MDNIITIANIARDVAPSITTLLAAFLGAWFAYKLEGNSKKREMRNVNINAANKALFNTFQLLNHTRLYQKDMIDPFRGNPGIFIMMRPTLPEKQDDSVYDFNSLTFLLGTKHKQVLFDLYIEQQRYREILKAIDYRSSLHFNKVQPTLIKVGMQEGIDYPGETFAIVLGKFLYSDLKQTTENIIVNVDKNVISLIEVKDNMISAFKDIFPDVKFIDIEPL